MVLKYIRNTGSHKKGEYKVYDCKYNEGCRCHKMECWKCGWNPKVAQARSEALEAGWGGKRT